MPNPDESGLPADWTEAELLNTVKSSFGVGTDSDLPVKTRFVKNVAQLIRQRLAKGAEDSDALSVFLRSPSPPAVVQASCKRIPMLDNALTKLSGKFWYVAEVLGYGHSQQIPSGQEDDDLFKYVTDTLGLGTSQAMILDTRTRPPTVRHYPNGLAEPNLFENISVTNAPVTFTEIFASIDRTHREGLVTPGVQGSGGVLWDDAQKHKPVSDAEKKIQYALKIGLANAFPTCTIREEQGMPAGRLDLEIEEADPTDRTKITRHAILELKVLRSFYSSGVAVSAKKIKDVVVDGITQALEYKRDRGAAAAALCCFDMRKDDTKDACFSHVKTIAKDKEVVLRRWPLFNSAKSYRDSLAA